MRIAKSISLWLILVSIVASYLAAGMPKLSILLNWDTLVLGVSLRPITYHWTNHWDRSLDEAHLFASRFYVYIIACVSLIAAWVVQKCRGRIYDIGLVALAFLFMAIFLNAQYHAYYTFG